MFTNLDVHVAWHKMYGDGVPSLNSMNVSDLAYVANSRTHGTQAERLFYAVTRTFAEPGTRLRCVDCILEFYPCANCEPDPS